MVGMTNPDVLTDIQLQLLLIREWERLQVRYEQGLRGDALFLGVSVSKPEKCTLRFGCADPLVSFSIMAPSKQMVLMGRSYA